jgi:CRP-like cAMP-binding protein
MLRIKISPELTRELRALATPVFKQKGTILFRAGYPARGAFLVRQGRVRLALDQEVELYPTRTLGSGSVIGLPATFSGEPYSLTAEAAEDCNLDFIPRRKLLNLLRRKPKIGFQIVRILSEEIFQMRKAAKISASKQAHHAVH